MTQLKLANATGNYKNKTPTSPSTMYASTDFKIKAMSLKYIEI